MFPIIEIRREEPLLLFAMISCSCNSTQESIFHDIHDGSFQAIITVSILEEMHTLKGGGTVAINS